VFGLEVKSFCYFQVDFYTRARGNLFCSYLK